MNSKLCQSEAGQDAPAMTTELGKSLAKVTINLVVKTGDDGKMFGAVVIALRGAGHAYCFNGLSICTRVRSN